MIWRFGVADLSLKEAEERILDVVGSPPEDIQTLRDHGEPLGGCDQERPHPDWTTIVTGSVFISPVPCNSNTSSIAYTM